MRLSLTLLLLFAPLLLSKADPVPHKAEASHFNLWLGTRVFKFFDGRGTLDVDRKKVKLTCIEETNRSIGGGGGRSGCYMYNSQDFILSLPDSTTNGEEVLAHLDDQIDPEGPFATFESIVIESSEVTTNGSALVILFSAHDGAVRGHASLTVSDTRDREAVLTSLTFEVYQTEVNR